MFKNVLIATDLESSGRVVPAAPDDLRTLGAERITLLFVTSAAARPGRTHENSDQLLERLAEHGGLLRAEGFAVESVVETGYSSAQIADAAHRLDADLIVIGGRSHRVRGRPVVGSTASEVVRRSEVPILLNPAPGPAGRHPLLDHILLATDGSAAATRAEAVGLALAGRAGRLTLMTVVAGTFELRSAAQSMRAHLDDIRERLDRDVNTCIVRQRRASDAIAAAAEREKATLMLIGRQGRSAGKVVGSTAENLTRKVSIPMIVVP